MLFLLKFDLYVLIWILNPPVCQIKENGGFRESINSEPVHAMTLCIFYGNSEFKWGLDSVMRTSSVPTTCAWVLQRQAPDGLSSIRREPQNRDRVKLHRSDLTCIHKKQKSYRRQRVS